MRRVKLAYTVELEEIPDKVKELCFWSNNNTSRNTSHADYLFSIPVAKSKDDADGRLDTVIDFPIPLLVMGGCNIGTVRDTSLYTTSQWDTSIRAEICYTILESTPDTASFDELKYKYLSAFTTLNEEGDGAGESEFAIRPDSASAKWTEDIEIWGGMVMNYKNAAGSAATAKTYVKNADAEIVATISVLKGATNAFQLNYPTGVQWPTASGSWSVGSLPTASFSAGSLPSLSPWSAGSLPSLSFSGGSLPSFPTIDWGHIIWADHSNYPDTPAQDDRKTWSLKAGGSDAQVTFYPYPVYCAGNAAGDDNMRVYTGATDDNDTRGTWFYRPVNAQGVDHGWV